VEAAGVEFIDENVGGAGVRMRHSRGPTRYREVNENPNAEIDVGVPPMDVKFRIST
jgi:hypothetical protein